MYKEMDGTIILNVPGLIDKRFPGELFHRLCDPQGDIAVVDPLGDDSRPDSATNAVDLIDRCLAGFLRLVAVSPQGRPKLIQSQRQIPCTPKPSRKFCLERDTTKAFALHTEQDSLWSETIPRGRRDKYYRKINGIWQVLEVD